MSIPFAIINIKATSDPVASIRYFSNPKKVVAVFDGLTTGAAVGTPKELVDLLLSNHHDKRAKRVCRTAVISVKTPRKASKKELEDIDQRLLQAASDLQKLIGVSLLGWVHGNTITRHMHLIFPNSNGVRTLNLDPQWLRELQSFAWTMALITGRGKGRRKALSVYPKSRKLVVRDLASVLVDEAGCFRKDQWESLVKSGAITNFRRRKNGDLISFEWNRKRVRVETLNGIITDKKNMLAQDYNETSPNNKVICPGIKSMPGSNRQPQQSPVQPVCAAAARLGKLDPLQIAFAAEQTVSIAIDIVSRGLQTLDNSPVVADEVAHDRTHIPNPIGPIALQIGGVVLKRRFKRHNGSKPGQAGAGEADENASTGTPKPTPRRFNRPNCPTIGF